MGSLIVIPSWLLDLAERGQAQQRVVRRIAETASRTAARSAHVLDLGAHQVRSAIAHSARWGHVARIPVRCSLCNAVAMLTDWDAVAHSTVQDHRDMAASVPMSRRPHDYLYIQRCPGAAVARALAETETAPRER